MIVHLTIAGRELEAADGADLLTTCLSHGVQVPHFCWHEALGSVGACRLCAVHVTRPDGSTRLEMACATPATPGLIIEPEHPDAAAFRAHVIELLMANHPHDCAVCEAGGACHLQDMTVLSGHRHRRAQGEKRLHARQDIGPFLTHEMNRCIACFRCTRFYRDYAGGRDFAEFGSQARLWFGRAAPGPLDSPFAGNLAELCPTGVFNDAAWSAAYARPWDMTRTPALCTRCAVGCNTTLHARDGRIRNAESRFHPALNRHFLCDRGRFGVHAAHGAGRAVDPTRVADARRILERGAIGLGSPYASLEANLALRDFVGSERFFAGVPDAGLALHARMLGCLAHTPARRASLADMAAADAVVVIAVDLVAEAPVAALMLRQASRGAERALAVAKGVPLFLDEAVRVAGEGRRSPFVVLSSGVTGLDDVASEVHRLAPSGMVALARGIAAALRGEPAGDDARRIAGHLAGADAPIIVATAGQGCADLIDAAAAIAAALREKAGLALIPPAANSFGLALLEPAGGADAAVVAARAAGLPILALEPDWLALPDDVALVRLDWLAGGPGLLLPIAAPEEAPGLFVNFEGRAQESHAAVHAVAPSATAMLAELAGKVPVALPQLRVRLAGLFPALAGLAEPPAQPFSRAAPGLSGRTADDRAGRVMDAVPALAEAGDAFGWGLENRGVDLPEALRTDWGGGGLHSPASLYRPALCGAPDTGVAIDLAAIMPFPSPAEESADSGLEPVPALDPFAASARDRASPFIAARLAAGPTAPPAPALHPDDATRLGLAAGARLTVGGRPVSGRLVLDASLAPGCIRLAPDSMPGTAHVLVEAAP